MPQYGTDLVRSKEKYMYVKLLYYLMMETYCLIEYYLRFIYIKVKGPIIN